MRDVAEQVGITERAVQKIVAELSSEGYVVAHRQGRRKHYEIVRDAHLRHPLESDALIGDLIDLANSAAPRGPRTTPDS